ncbi:hypothetical protein DACRYDRAFT_74965 [Dacryopinax primogenitus]|uniref:Mitochondrial import receptor subunit tom40 n=1 Tax=Dacryopinax primogenitus (strain DJM 731) TaxID=1858805 RepID=M5GB90_DACPD|nr:uncharacterized protein DACRYDRAFT_74965 [Dacryopinax primogenitus]EJU05660.1 hypothetical protein DACRYDRAFT_74965 [Dacryopinax primogenitus]
MASYPPYEKPGSTSSLSYVQNAVEGSLKALSPVVSPFTGVYTRFVDWRKSFGLPNPGSSENLQKEIKSAQLTQWMFDGARADLTKGLSMNPAFQVTHSFSLGSSAPVPAYNFGALFGDANSFLQGGVDNDGNVNAKCHLGWTPTSVTKLTAQMSGSASQGSMFQFEHDFQGSDFTFNLKAINPTEPAKIFIGNWLQSVTSNLALGVEGVYQVQPPSVRETQVSGLVKYTSSARNWIATAHIRPVGVLEASYWHKLSEKMEVGANLELVHVPMKREAVATVGAKYDLRMSTFRAQVDSTGKVSALLEQKFAPSFAFLVSGEIDHVKNSAKVGVGVMIESSSLTPEEMGLVQPMQPVGL